MEQKGGHTMEMATDEPTPTASHQELSGSNTGHFTVTYDSEDTNYCARVDELVRAVESMPFVNQLGQLGGERLGVRASLTCYAAREYSSCKCKQSNIERGSERGGPQNQFGANMKFRAKNKKYPCE